MHRSWRNSGLSIVLVALALLSAWLLAVGGAGDHDAEQAAHGQPERVPALQCPEHSRFWFESFRNRQREFRSLAMMVLLSLWLRQRGSPESKPVDAAHDDTGTDWPASGVGCRRPIDRRRAPAPLVGGSRTDAGPRRPPCPAACRPPAAKRSPSSPPSRRSRCRRGAPRRTTRSTARWPSTSRGGARANGRPPR